MVLLEISQDMILTRHTIATTKPRPYVLVTSREVEPEEIRGNSIQPDYRDIIKKFKASLKTMQESGLECTLRKEYLTYTQQWDGRQ